MKDLYESLGVARTATPEEIKKAYRQITRKFHPDKNPGNKAAEERFKVASTAYDVLSDPERRQLYDEFGEASLTQGFDAERARAYKQARAARGGFGSGDTIFDDMGEARATSFDDLLSRLFGGGRVQWGPGGAGGPQPRRAGADISGEIRVSFLDALAGVTVPLRIDAGDGTQKTLDVRVPPGMTDLGKLRLRGQGGTGHPPGDILLTVRVDPHPRLSREGQDLRMTLPVTAYEAYRGGPVDVWTPWGLVSVKIPAGSQNGQTLRLKGRGVRQPNKPSGDLLVTLDVRLPPAGDERLLQLLEELQAHENPRTGLA